jgi:hypothetical protein
MRLSRTGLSRPRWCGSRLWEARYVTSAAGRAKPHIYRALAQYIDAVTVRDPLVFEQALKDALMELRRDRPFA